MLQLRRGFGSSSKLDFPHSVRRPVQHKFAFAPVADEEDELLDQIEESQANAWEFGDQSEAELEEFWDHVVADVRNDPNWNFASDD